MLQTSGLIQPFLQFVSALKKNGEKSFRSSNDNDKTSLIPLINADRTRCAFHCALFLANRLMKKKKLDNIHCVAKMGRGEGGDGNRLEVKNSKTASLPAELGVLFLTNSQIIVIEMQSANGQWNGIQKDVCC